MRIAHVVQQLEIGGLERMVVALASAQARAGLDVRVYCLEQPGLLAGELAEMSVPVHAFHKGRGFSARVLYALARQIRADRLDIVHSHNAVVHHYAAYGAAGHRAMVVNTQHGVSALARTTKQRLLFRATLPRTRAVVFVSANTRDFVEGQLGIRASRTEIIYNAIDVGEFACDRPAPGSRLPLIRFGTIGRMVMVKDHATLIRAFSLLLPRLPLAELRIMGSGHLQAETERCAADLGLGPAIAFYPPDFKVVDFLAALDVFVLSSETEGIPITVLEAMAAGVPIVSTRVGGVPEAAPEGDVAWYCPHKDPAALAGAMYAAATSGELARRSAQARRIAAGRFGLEPMVNRYAALYADLLRGRTARPASNDSIEHH